MKLLFFTRDISDCGGIQQTTCNLVSNLLMRDPSLEISIISLYHKNILPFFSIPNKVERIALFEKKINLHGASKKIKNRINKILRSLEFDVLIVQGCEYSNYIPTSIWGKKVIVCEHEYFGFGHTFGIHWRGVKKSISKASAIVTLTELDANDFRKKNKRQIPIIHIYNALVEIDKKLKQNVNDSKCIVSCGSLVQLKGFDRAIEVARKLFVKYPDWTWFIYGEGEYRSQLEKLITNYHLENKVFLKGYENDKAKIYADKAMLVVTSDFEGFGMVMIEAMQFGLPIVSFDIKYGPKEIVEDKKNGELIPIYDCTKLADRLGYLIENPELRNQYSEYTSKSIERFSPQKIVSEWYKLINIL